MDFPSSPMSSSSSARRLINPSGKFWDAPLLVVDVHRRTDDDIDRIMVILSEALANGRYRNPS